MNLWNSSAYGTLKKKKLKRIFKRIFLLAIIDDEVGFEIGKKIFL